MAHARTGKDGAVTWGGGAINGKLQDWNLEFTGENVVDRGAGESWQSRNPLFSDWKVTFTAFKLDQADRSLSSATAETALINTTTTIALKEKSGDANPYFTSTGLTTSIQETEPIDGNAAFTVTVECSEGTAPTMDTTPAS